VIDEEGSPIEGRSASELLLQPGEQQRVLIRGQLPLELEPGQFAALEVIQACEEQIVGSLGIVLTAGQQP